LTVTATAPAPATVLAPAVATVTAPSFNCNNPGEGFNLAFGGRFYRLISDRTYDQSKTHCEAVGSQLAEIYSQEEYDETRKLELGGLRLEEAINVFCFALDFVWDNTPTYFIGYKTHNKINKLKGDQIGIIPRCRAWF
jgi:hypothetical protein